MWTLLSFTGVFDVAFLENAIAKAAKNQPRMPGERSREEKALVRDAQMARGSLRRGKMLDRLEGKTFRRFIPKQLEVLREYRSGRLRKEANKLTMISGHGRLKRQNESFVDVGGNIGGFVRTVFDDWGPPDLTDVKGATRFRRSRSSRLS